METNIGNVELKGASLDVDVLFEGLGKIVEKQGYMNKQGGSWKTWKRRYFMLRGNFITYFENEGESSPKGVINLDGAEIEICNLKKWGKEYCFEVHHLDRRTFILQANSEQHRNSWVEAIQKGIEYPLLAPKLKKLFREKSQQLEYMDQEQQRAAKKEDELRREVLKLQKQVDENQATVSLFSLKMEAKDSELMESNKELESLKARNLQLEQRLMDLTRNSSSQEEEENEQAISGKALQRIQTLEDEKTSLVQKVKELSEKYNKKRAERELLRKEVLRLRKIVDE